MHISGSNVSPARDLSEAEAREAIAQECEHLANGYENQSRLTKTARQRNFWLNRAAERRACASRLRKGAPS